MSPPAGWTAWFSSPTLAPAAPRSGTTLAARNPAKQPSGCPTSSLRSCPRVARPAFHWKSAAWAAQASVGGYLLSQSTPAAGRPHGSTGRFLPGHRRHRRRARAGTPRKPFSRRPQDAGALDLLLGKVWRVAALAALTGLLNLASMSVTLIQVMRLADSSMRPCPCRTDPRAACFCGRWFCLSAAFLSRSSFVRNGGDRRARDSKRRSTSSPPVYFLGRSHGGCGRRGRVSAGRPLPPGSLA